MVTFSPTSTPPPSRATFHVRPKSLRLNSVLASKPARVPPHGSCWTPWNSHLQLDGPGDRLNGEVPLQRELVAVQIGYLSRGEGDGRVVLDVGEVGGLQVGVAILVTGVDRRGVDHDLDRRLEGVVRDGEGAVKRGEAAADLADHEVSGGEVDRRMGRIDLPGAGGDEDGCRGTGHGGLLGAGRGGPLALPTTCERKGFPDGPATL